MQRDQLGVHDVLDVDLVGFHDLLELELVLEVDEVHDLPPANADTFDESDAVRQLDEFVDARDLVRDFDHHYANVEGRPLDADAGAYARVVQEGLRGRVIDLRRVLLVGARQHYLGLSQSRVFEALLGLQDDRLRVRANEYLQAVHHKPPVHVQVVDAPLRHEAKDVRLLRERFARDHPDDPGLLEVLVDQTDVAVVEDVPFGHAPLDVEDLVLRVRETHQDIGPLAHQGVHADQLLRVPNEAAHHAKVRLRVTAQVGCQLLGYQLRLVDHHVAALELVEVRPDLVDALGQDYESRGVHHVPGRPFQVATEVGQLSGVELGQLDPVRHYDHPVQRLQIPQVVYDERGLSTAGRTLYEQSPVRLHLDLQGVEVVHLHLLVLGHLEILQLIHQLVHPDPPLRLLPETPEHYHRKPFLHRHRQRRVVILMAPIAL